MGRDLTVSNIERQNVLNNRIAVDTIRRKLELSAMLFGNEYCFTTQMVAGFYEVDERTIKRYLENHEQELRHNGYFLCRGKHLKEFKLLFGHVINVPTKTTVLGLFNFRSFLNIGMLLSESEKAKQLRNLILDIVISGINEKTGGGTKYINRKDANYLSSAIVEINYRKVLTSAINKCVDGHPTIKYANITDYIYKTIFKENAKEYREVLKLEDKDSARSTMYAEVLLLIASFENGVGYEIKNKAEKNGGKLLSIQEVYAIIDAFGEHPFQLPYLNDARTKMASRDFGFRDAYHGNIAEYLCAVSPEEFDRFIGNKSIDFDAILEENKDILKRLKQSESEEHTIHIL
ncbi:hypothetical protein EZS27_016266 [termite gut metagenome]|uniref:DNA-binding protein n=1 Tax=termite gut metagenome TaxID=433724 RepID=A0A5J4RPD7_9ZZZZ